jgi:succinate-acetate transporter protein
MASKGRVPMTTPTHLVGRRLWFVSLAIIVAIVAVGIIVSRDSQPHIGSDVAVRLAAAAIVTACAAVTKIAAGRRAAAATAVVGVLIAVVLLTRPA